MPDLLKEHREELLSEILVLSKADLKTFVNRLCWDGILQHVPDFTSLLQDRNQVDLTLVCEYVVNQIPKSLNQDLWEKFLEVLGSFESTASLCHTLSHTLRTGETGSVTSKHVGEKRPLQEGSVVTLMSHHVPILASLLTKCSHKWEEIAILLGLPEHIIEECRNRSSYILKLHEVLCLWIKGDGKFSKPATLPSLVESLRGDVLNMSSLAESLSENFQECCEEQKRGIKKPRLQSNSQIRSSSTDVCDGMPTLLGIPYECGENAPYKWMKDGELLSNGSDFNGATEDVLFIRDVRQGLEGRYTCSTQDGKTIFLEKHLQVIFSPEKKKLLNKYEGLQEVPNSWPPIGTSTYIQLALVHNQKSDGYDHSVRGDMDDILEKKEKGKYEELFAKYHERSIIIVEGRPGCGKTTLTHKISRDWARGPNILKGAKLVLLIPLRLCSTIRDNNLQAILNIVFSSEKISHAVADKLEDCDGEGACFVIDGLDEYPNRSDPTDIVYKLLHKSYLCQAMVIVASRPVGTAELRHTAKQRVEVLGFSKSQILKYLGEYDFKTGINSASSLEAYLNTYINVYHMCYLPVHAAMICSIYDHNRGVVPNTETKIYELFTLLTIKRKLQQDGEQSVVVDELNKLKGVIKECFSNVCKLAFDMTVSSKQAVFKSETETFISDTRGSKAHSLGLVTIDSTAKLLGYDDLYAFLHLTFQEFLAAYHLSTVGTQEQLQIITAHKTRADMNVVWKFFCGLVKFNSLNYPILTQIMSIKSNNDLFRFQCALESQQKVVCDSSFKFHETSSEVSVAISDHNFLSIDLNAMGFAIAETRLVVTKLMLTNCSLNLEGIKSFVELIGPTKLKAIKSLYFSTNGEKEQFKILNFFLNKLDSLELLDLAGMELKSDSVETMTDKVELPLLNCLVIQMPLAYSSDIDCLRCLSFNSKKLEKVCYDYVDDNFQSHKTCLMYLIKHFSCELVSLSDIPNSVLCNLEVDVTRIPTFFNLSTILLVNCNIQDLDLEYLSHTDMNDTVETLRLDFNKITCKGTKFISEVLTVAKNLRILSVSCNSIGDEGALAISEALQHSSLSELDLQGNTISSKGAVAIANAVKGFMSSFSLILWNINISPKGAGEVLKHWPNACVENQKEICAQNFIIANLPEPMARVINCCANLVTLDFSGKNINYYAAEALARNLKFCIHLKELNLSRCNLSFCVLNELGKGLQTCKHLKSVNFGGNKILSNDIPRLIAPLKLCPCLQELDVHDNPLKFSGINNVAFELSRCRLKSLNLSFTMIDKYGAALLAKYLRLGSGHTRYFSRKDLFPDQLQERFRAFVLTHLNKGVKQFLKDNGGARHCWCTSLEIFDLGWNKIRCEGAAALAYGLQYCTTLKTLDLSQNYIGIDGISVLAHGLKCCLQLQTLILSHNPFEAKGAAVLFSQLEFCTKLQVLHCEEVALCSSNRMETETKDRNCKVHLDAVIALASALRNWSDFKELILSKNDIDCTSIKQLAQGLKFADKLEKLDISNNRIAAEGMAALAESLQSSYLTNLRLNDNQIKENGAQSLCIILKNCSSISSLGICSNDIGSFGAEILGIGLKNCLQLMDVHVSSNKIGSRGVKMLMDGLKHCTKLQCINLCDNDINSDGVIELVSGLKHLTKFEALYLSENNIGLEGCRALRDWLCKQEELAVGQENEDRPLTAANLKNFGTLLLADCGIGSRGALEIADGLKHCSNFHNLDLEKNNIGSAGAVQLCMKLKRCRSLRWVRLNNNQIDSNGAIELAKRLKFCSNMQQVDI